VTFVSIGDLASLQIKRLEEILSNTSGVQQACRDYAGVTVGDPVANWHAVFDKDEIPEADFNGRMIAWINAKLGTTYPDLAGAQQAFAVAQGFNNWASMDDVSFE
jgi:hypothetical protein